MSCVVLLIGNDDEEEDADDDDDEEEEEEEEDEDDDENEDDDLERSEGKVKLACACARRLWHVLNHTRNFSGHPVCGDPILLPNKNKKKIREGIWEAVQLVKYHKAAWLIIYYAGHAFWDGFYKEVVIEPKAHRRGMKLEKKVKLTVHKAELEFTKTTIFVDSCLIKKKAGTEAEDDYQLGDSKKGESVRESVRDGNTFVLVKSCEKGESVRDGCLFARAIERCARVDLDQRRLKEQVEELAWQLSFGRLCPTSSCIAEINYMVLTEKQRRRGLFENTHFLRFALDLWTEDKLEPEDSDIDETLQILQRIATEFERKQAAFEESWHELDAIGHSSNLEDFLECLQRLETLKDGSWRPMPVLIPENVRGAIVEVLQEKIRDPKFQRESETNFADLRYLVQDIGEWYTRWEGQKPLIPPETGTCNFLLDEEVKDFDVEGPLQQWPGLAYSLVVEDLDIKNFEESERKKLAEEINQLCEDFGIRGRVYLVPGSLWIVFCVNVELSRDCRKKLAASLKSWIKQQKQSGANGWTLARDPCWKPLHAVPDQILDLVRQVESLCATCLPTKPMWLRASDLRNLVAETMREKQLEEWRVVVFEGLVERRGDSWLQGTGTLGCCLLPHFHDERLDHRMQEVANLACKREKSMRSELQALVFLLQRTQLELTDKEWTQVVDNARFCYERLKTVLRKIMLDKDTDLIVKNDPAICHDMTKSRPFLEKLLGEDLDEKDIVACLKSFVEGYTANLGKQRHFLIVCDGNIGCGKTAFLDEIANSQHLPSDVQIFREPVAKNVAHSWWSLMEKFYRDMKNSKGPAAVIELENAIWAHHRKIATQRESHVITERCCDSSLRVFCKALQKKGILPEGPLVLTMRPDMPFFVYSVDDVCINNCLILFCSCLYL